jgi:hypothetical protein
MNIKEILYDFYFRNFGFKKEDNCFALKTINNYEKFIKGGKSDTTSMKRYIKRLKIYFNIK